LCAIWTPWAHGLAGVDFHAVPPLPTHCPFVLLAGKTTATKIDGLSKLESRRRNTPMPRKQIITLMLLVLVAASFSSAKDSEQESIRFHFAPPNGTTFVQRTKAVRTVYVGGRKRTVRETEIVTRDVVKKTPQGYDIAETTVSASVKENGKRRPDPLLEGLAGSQLTLKISAAGELKDIQGTEKAINAALSKVAPKARPAVQKHLTRSAIMAQARSEWDARVTQFLRLKGKIGDIFEGQAEAPIMTGGTLALSEVSKLAALTRCGSGKCVKVTAKFKSDPESAQKTLAAAMTKVVNEGDGPKMKVSDVSMSGTSEYVVDPATMLIYSERTERVTDMTLEIAGEKGKALTRAIEKREVTSQYGK
jgi:hypothetical protein